MNKKIEDIFGKGFLIFLFIGILGIVIGWNYIYFKFDYPEIFPTIYIVCMDCVAVMGMILVVVAWLDIFGKDINKSNKQ